MKNNKVPQIRFKSFNSPWEEKKLFDVIYYRNGKAHENSISVNGAFIVINSKFVSTNGLVKKFSNKQFSPLFKNELAFVLSDVPNGRAIARTFLVDLNNKYTLNQRIAALSPKEGYNCFFLNKLINRNSYFLQFDDGVKQTNLRRSDVENFSTKYPNLSEQTQIGNFFKTLDEQINLQEQKHQKLINLKKAMLEKMFPKEGADIPEIRFKEFTEKWEEKKLNVVASIIGGGTPSTNIKEYWNGDLNWFSPTEIGKTIYVSESIKKITKLGLENSSARILPPNKTILFTSRAGIGDMAILKKEAATNQGFQSFIVNNNFNVYFLFSLGNLIKKKAIIKASGSTFLEISGKTLGELSFRFPSLAEQQKIGDYFEKLDTLIQQSQIQIDKYKNIKQALLQKMFV